MLLLMDFFSYWFIYYSYYMKKPGTIETRNPFVNKI